MPEPRSGPIVSLRPIIGLWRRIGRASPRAGLIATSALEVIIGAGYGYFGALEVSDSIGNPSLPVILHASFQVMISLAFLAAGVGLFMLWRWSRTLNIVIGIFFAVYGVLTLGALFITQPFDYLKGVVPFLLIKAFFLGFAVFLLCYLTRPRIKEAFGIAKKA